MIFEKGACQNNRPGILNKLVVVLEQLKLADEERERQVGCLKAGLHLAFARLRLGCLLKDRPAASVETRTRLLQVPRSICLGL